MQEHLIPELIKNLVDQYKTAKHENERLSLQARLKTTRDFIDAALGEKSKTPLVNWPHRSKGNRY